MFPRVVTKSEKPEFAPATRFPEIGATQTDHPPLRRPLMALDKMETFLVTGCAGFIGSRVAELLLAEGHAVVGIDNLNDYYDVGLKQHRLARLRESSNFEFQQTDIEDLRGSTRCLTSTGFRRF